MLHFLVVAGAHLILLASALPQLLVHLHLRVFQSAGLGLPLALLLVVGHLLLLLGVALGCYRSELLQINLFVAVQDARGRRFDLLLVCFFVRLEPVDVLHLRFGGLAVRGQLREEGVLIYRRSGPLFVHDRPITTFVFAHLGLQRVLLVKHHVARAAWRVRRRVLQGRHTQHLVGLQVQGLLLLD